MTEKIRIAIVGAGPAGLSAAVRAAEASVSHLLLEKSQKHADTIQKYQKGKYVMAEPNVLPLRSGMPFQQGTREDILEGWAHALDRHSVNVRYGANVSAIDGRMGSFSLTLDSGEIIQAENIILGIGVQGNLRKLDVPGGDSDCVQYQLDDPDEYRDESVVIVGAGDAAIENALALSSSNRVAIINRRAEFSRAKDGNVAAISSSIESGEVTCFYHTSPVRLDQGDFDGAPAQLVLSTAKGEVSVSVNRVIARLGAVPQRALVESFGVEFPSQDPNALPELSSRYECNVPGMYIIGALGGYPLIKQALNQGYEVVEHILGNKVDPADHPLLEEKFKVLPYQYEVQEILSMMQDRIPIFSEVNSLMFRELILGSSVHAPAEGALIFEKDDYTNTFYTIVNGSVQVEVASGLTVTVGQGEFFGEMGLISGRRRSATVRAGPECVLIETPRRAMNKLLSSVNASQRALDETFIVRTIQSRFAPQVPIEILRPIAAAARINQYDAGEAIFIEGDEADSLHIIRSGSVSVARRFQDKEIPIAYVAAGNYVGEMGLLGNSTRSATARASARTETVSLDADAFNILLDKTPSLRNEMEAEVRTRTQQNVRMRGADGSGDVLSFLMQQGLGEATDVLLIDKSLCVNCNNCEIACAETHDGTSRLNRRAGAVFAEIHVPTSCRHCEDPQCMKDCPPDAIHRAPSGEVFIGDNCIGCGNCEQNCPYGVVQMAHRSPPKPGFWSWMLFGAGPGPGQSVGDVASDSDIKKAVKCDMCKDLSGGPACVRACPTGAAARISPEDFVSEVSLRLPHGKGRSG